MIETENVTIWCEIDANPSDNLTLTWFKDSNVVNVEDEKFDFSEPEFLIISEVGPEDAGQYSCVAENEVGLSNESNTATLDVLCKIYSLIIDWSIMSFMITL